MIPELPVGHLVATVAGPLLEYGFGLVWTAGCGLFVAVGLYLVAKGRTAHRRASRIGGTGTVDARALDPGTGAAAEVSGTARPTEEGHTVTAPLSGREALAVTIEVERYSTTGERNSWLTLLDYGDGVELLVDDGTATVLVDPAGSGSLHLEETTWDDPDVADPDGRIREFVEERTGPAGELPDGLGDSSRSGDRYTEGVLQPGDDVYVLGSAREGDGWDDPQVVVDEPTQDGDFLVSNRSETDLTRELVARAGRLYLFGAAFAGVGVLFAAIYWLSRL